MKYANDSLAEVIAQTVHFGRDDYKGETLPESVAFSLAYLVSCFAAQHTVEGRHGVDTETGLAGLAVEREMPYPERVELARAFVKDLGGEIAPSLAARCHALADELLGANIPADLAPDLLRVALHRVGDYLESEDAPTLADALRALIASADKSGGRLRTVSRVDVDRARATLAAHDKARGQA